LNPDSGRAQVLPPCLLLALVSLGAGGVRLLLWLVAAPLRLGYAWLPAPVRWLDELHLVGRCLGVLLYALRCDCLPTRRRAQCASKTW
jgi:hypothetical protein